MCTAARCLRPCNRISSTLSVTPSHLRIGSERINSYDDSLPAEVKCDILESYKMFQAL